MQTMQAQRLLNAYKLVAYVNRPGTNSQGHFDFVVGNVKALLKLNVENEYKKRDRGEWVGGFRS